MKSLKKALIFLFVLVAVFFTVTCSSEVYSLQTELGKKLSSIDGIVSVERIVTTNPEDNFSERYMVEFEQPISWNNQNLGSFKQRAFIGYRGLNSINVFLCGGYSLDDYTNPDYFKKYNGEELTNHYDANIINLEYRFFGKSVPEGLSVDSELYWEYLNSEEASKDFHHIITQLKTVLGGSTIFTGASKGGYTTENMACYFPDDIDAYVSFVAPLCNSTNDPRFYQNICCTIGDLTYGPVKAKYYRDKMLEFQKLILTEEYRTVIQKYFIEQFDMKKATLSPLISSDEAYEISVMEVATSVWQYKQNFEKIEQCLDMPDTNQEEIDKKIKLAKEIFDETDPVDGLDIKNAVSPYYIQAYTEMGNYLIDLSYLRNAGANIKTPAANDVSMGVRSAAPLMINCSLEYSQKYKDKLLDFFKTTEKDIIKIYGKGDTWYAVRMPDTNNPHIHIFEVDNSHISEINMLPENEKTECYNLIDNLLKR